MKLRPQHGVPLLLLAAAVSEQAYADVTAKNDVARGAVNDTIVINVLANDVFTGVQFGDPFVNVDNGESGLKPAENGSVSVNNDGSITYVPNPDFQGQDTFEYEVFENGEDYGSDIALVTVSVGVGASSIVVGDNNKSTGEMIDSVCDDSNSDNVSEELAAACAGIGALTDEELAQLTAEITPEEILVTRRMMSEMSRGQTDRIYSGQQLIRQGLNPSQLVLNGTSIPLADYKGGTASSDQAAPIGVFGTIHIDQVEHDASGLESAYDSDTYGVTVGVDYRLRPNLHVGGAFDWATHEVEYAQESGQLDSDVYSLTGYFSWFANQQLGVDVQLGYAMGTIDTKRNITVPVTQVVYGDTDSEQWNLSTQVQWTFSRDGWTLTPYLRLDYIMTEVDGYDETGDSAWLMGVGDQEMNQLSTSLGVSGTYAVSYDWGVWVPGFSASMVSENSSDYSPVEFSLLADSSSNGEFSLQPESEDSLFYEAEINSVFILAGGFSTFVSVRSIEGYENITAYQYSLGFNYEM
ncbi:MULTISPECIES: autotransporter domain-containing protein [unclassified Ketobacter]|jgi:outer membrane autotransporter protein|uniref:autotransporter domain-containing protein n=1 Tax=unclassified Ketobacter TaxID=2639109 RepID=UPI0025C180A7|nr:MULTISPECIES: autotransporter domain-containing protein [unclassified Ketobacter]MEC8813195.1 autotransporter domain-containing protein [Pseudomonadota bacterium]|tara:strand:+ start:1233 stop:2798 length:1566 start_codon:yes stop_codon:yes gene_type:complete